MGNKTRRRIQGCRLLLVRFLRFLWQAVKKAYFAFAAVLLFIFAAIFFYQWGNPTFDFSPGNITMSWWPIFIGRQLLTLELARILEWLLIGGLTWN